LRSYAQFFKQNKPEKKFYGKKLGIFLLMKKSMKFLAYKRQGTTVVLLV